MLPTDRTLSASALLRLMQLVSPALPIGAYNFSQGLEYAVEARWVSDEPTALRWIQGLAHNAIGMLDVPILLRLHAAWLRNDTVAVERCSRFLIASRETSELRAEDRHLGRALAKVLVAAGLEEVRGWMSHADATFATLFALACARWNINATDAAHGYVWAWAENQVLAAVKATPLGQSAGQRMLDALIARIPEIVARAANMADDEIGNASPLHFVASAAHETQYTRLFRS